MAIRPIVTWGYPTLHVPASRVDRIDADMIALADDMVETMYAAPGIGLAAPQVAVPRRLIVIDLSLGARKEDLIRMVNPEIVEHHGEQRHVEGCLSIPGYDGSPVRPERVVVRGLDLHGRERLIEARGLLARALCHEIDHIDGLLFVDRLSPLRRGLLRRRLDHRARKSPRAR
jgi:peptide deformylase